ncbi:MAG: peptidylprolyl isomerase [Candidatus Altiarchaeota archaeon]|nr:peptidylprolyl isomerase [Candidatus Altiarchaeota archaeon]
MDFVKINYTGKLEDGKVFDTTDPELAKKEGIFDEKRVYKPLTVAVGEGQVIKALDEALKSMNVGEKKTVTCDPEGAYGRREASMIRLIPVKYFKQQKMNPFPGLPVEIDGMRGRVQTVSGGRVRVDFNHELAGKTLVFDIEVVEKAQKDEDKIKYLLERSFEGSEGVEIKLAGKKLELVLPTKAFHDRNILVRKATFSAEAFKNLGLTEITYTETWENPKKEKKEDKKEETTEEKKE